MIRTRVVVPYTTLYPETAAALERDHITPEYVKLNGPFEYAALLCDLWRDQRTFVVIEHDIVPRVGDLSKLLRCPCPWCGYVYNIGSQYAACMGFTKFRADLMRRYPDAMRQAAADDRDGMEAGIWVRMDVRLDNVLQPKGAHIHSHWPPVEHLNPKQVITCELTRGWCHWPARQDPN